MAGDKKTVPVKANMKKFSRRDFVVGGGTALAGGALAVVSPEAAEAAIKQDSYPLATHYLVYDSKHCAGCYGCMTACSLVHEGEINFSLSRIQMHRAVLDEYPFDISINVCRQCPTPLCVENCPTGAAHISVENGNIRMIDKEKCIGCKTCIKSCPFIPHRTIWNHITMKATKCDLCVDTPFYNKKGGPGGTQACVEACVANALKVVTELPDQTDISGYDRDLQPPRKAMPKFPFGAPKGKSKAAPAAKKS
ncbi:MAG: 4Fe-4S dicluster domain-containing protein [Acidobacteria bacterium]|nr:4Fe-4S dicluster domain-containing protein [Acidobacteriota bacterium]